MPIIDLNPSNSWRIGEKSFRFYKKDIHEYKVPSEYIRKFLQVQYELWKEAKQIITSQHFFVFFGKNKMCFLARFLKG